ncbi:L-aspartate oxidase [Reticulibacter mediterranei]|uniref:L-aspartate oxidase n=1 Tax=Reticulibacter mediterranei TaxID=2778369 RepID=A0A8J3ISN9_9CHLR|nr:L-aspartate oxidase [Reticulibacter mediterranei]GHO96195.1 L-aspartate oxidase [Reticulibacter mediterranei]
MTFSQPGQAFDVAIIGGGIAGLSVALRLPAHMRIALFTKGLLGESNTRYAQGGLAVAMGADDNPELHYQDTMVAGAGLCDEEAVRILVEHGPEAVQWLIDDMGVQFDRAQPGSDAHSTPDGLLLGREAAHCRWRVLHAGGDASGAEIERALMTALRARSSIALYEETFVSDLLVEDGVCVGVQAVDRNEVPFTIMAQSIVLANGGAGGLWLHTSNPSGATADGIALAWRAGAAVADLEFMQFHPTVLMVNGTSHLISEAVRGEGGYLRNHAGERFMPRYSEQDELAPRDVVARAILSEMLKEQTECQYLDLRHLPAEKMHARFPTISAICRQNGLDLATDLLPVAPAAHYCMGGVLVDTEGRTTLPGLYAVGEVSCTGVHGANRLASNSLLEGLVYGIRVADHLTASAVLNDGHTNSYHARKGVSTIIFDSASDDEVPSSGNANERSPLEIRGELRQMMWQYVSLRREREGLLTARNQVKTLQALVLESGNEERQLSPRIAETINMLQVAELVIAAALERRESRGSHWRSDYQTTDDLLAGRHYAFQHSRIDPYGLSFRHKEVIRHV